MTVLNTAILYYKSLLLIVMISSPCSMVHMERTFLMVTLLITMAMDHKDMDQAGIRMDILQITILGM